MAVLLHTLLIWFHNMFPLVICGLAKRIFLLHLVLFQNLLIEDLVFVDLYFEIICQLISNVLKLYLKLKHFDLFL